MEELLNFKPTELIYFEFAVAVVLVTELIRYLVKGIDKRIAPRWLSLFIAIILSVAAFYYYQSVISEHLWKSISSFAISIMGYDMIWKPLKKKLLPGLDEKQRL